MNLPTVSIKLCLTLGMLASVAFGCSSEAKLKGSVQSTQTPQKAPEPKAEDSKPAVVSPEPPSAVVVPPPVVVEPPAPVKPPVIEGAIQKGSFTVWTEPKDPKKDEDYRIYVQVKLPSNVSNYTPSDLTGEVIGTDEYTQRFGGNVEHDDFKLTKDTATLGINVPGAEALVKDTIKVRSIILNESQEIVIVF